MERTLYPPSMTDLDIVNLISLTRRRILDYRSPSSQPQSSATTATHDIASTQETQYIEEAKTKNEASVMPPRSLKESGKSAPPRPNKTKAASVTQFSAVSSTKSILLPEFPAKVISYSNPTTQEPPFHEESGRKNPGFSDPLLNPHASATAMMRTHVMHHTQQARKKSEMSQTPQRPRPGKSKEADWQALRYAPETVYEI